MIEGTNFHGAAKAIQEGLIAGRIYRGSGEPMTLEGATVHRLAIPAGLWRGWYSHNDMRFWVTGDFTRVIADRHGNPDFDHRIEAFGVRFEPRGIEALLPERLQASLDSRAPGRRGGRRPRTTGEPIARVVMRLMALPASELASYKVEALTAELVAEFRALGLNPPHEDNAKRDASGILRALRERGAQPSCATPCAPLRPVPPPIDFARRPASRPCGPTAGCGQGTASPDVPGSIPGRPAQSEKPPSPCGIDGFNRWCDGLLVA